MSMEEVVGVWMIARELLEKLPCLQTLAVCYQEYLVSSILVDAVLCFTRSDVGEEETTDGGLVG